MCFSYFQRPKLRSPAVSPGKIQTSPTSSPFINQEVRNICLGCSQGKYLINFIDNGNVPADCWNEEIASLNNYESLLLENNFIKHPSMNWLKSFPPRAPQEAQIAIITNLSRTRRTHKKLISLNNINNTTFILRALHVKYVHGRITGNIQSKQTWTDRGRP